MRIFARRILPVVTLLATVAAFAVLFLPALGAPQRSGLEVRGFSLAHMHRGGSGYGSEGCREQLAKIREMGGNWVSVTEFAWMRAVDQPDLRYAKGDRPMGESAGIGQTIKDARAAGLKVLVKPHVWSGDFGRGGKWAADIAMKSEEDWAKWFEQYTAFIVQHAKMAAENGAEALSVGCELEGTSAAQEKRWRELIAKVREVYKGYVIYSSAFAEWPKVPWWDAVDCIGIDAYMPLTDVEDASDEVLKEAWARIYEKDLGPFQRKWGKPICFTELGYSASINAAARPWAYDVNRPSAAYQARLYKVALSEAAKRDYVRGAFVWKWFTGEPGGGGRGDAFMIQGRPEVLEAIRNRFK